MGGTQIGARLSREMASVPGGKPAHGAAVPYPPKTVALCRSHHENTEDHLRACRAQGSTESIRLNLQKPFVLECVTAVGLTEAGGGLKTASIPGKMDSPQLHGPAASRGFRLSSLMAVSCSGWWWKARELVQGWRAVWISSAPCQAAPDRPCPMPVPSALVLAGSALRP